MSRSARIALCAVACAFAFPALAQANTQTVRDGNDRPGPLDIRSATASHEGAWIRHTITTFARWRTSLIGGSTPHFLAVGLDVRGNARFERLILFVARSNALRAFLIAPNGSIVGRLRASRPNGRSVSVLISRNLLDNVGGYYWDAISVFQRRGRQVVDLAPNRRLVLHDVRAPSIDLISFPELSTDTSADVIFPVSFAIADHRRSAGGVRWELQRRLVGSPAWESQGGQAGTGTKNVAVVGVEGAHYLFRVIARDRHGNVRTSGVRSVSVPLDDRNAVFAGAYDANWSAAAGAAPYLNTLMVTSTPEARFTYTFSGSEVAVLAPGGGPGTALITVDGGGAEVDLSDYAGDRNVVFRASGLDPSEPHTILIRHQTGTFAIDGLVVR